MYLIQCIQFNNNHNDINKYINFKSFRNVLLYDVFKSRFYQ